MFEQSKTKVVSVKALESGGSINLIGAGTIIEGEVRASRDLKVDGTIIGLVSSKSRLW